MLRHASKSRQVHFHDTPFRLQFRRCSDHATGLPWGAWKRAEIVRSQVADGRGIRRALSSKHTTWRLQEVRRLLVGT